MAKVWKAADERLFVAIFKNDKAGLISALEAGANINERDCDKRPPLMHATIDRRTDLLRLLIQSGAQLEFQDSAGFSALHFAAQNNYLEGAQILIAAGANVNIKDQGGNAPLFKAIFSSDEKGEMIQLMLKAGVTCPQHLYQSL